MQDHYQSLNYANLLPYARKNRSGKLPQVFILYAVHIRRYKCFIPVNVN